eukprot:TRINITY_DN23289_c0_g2_i1.p1 TRINITY_DN23289_c0_g2~~TRINITY_DN23289_c0_g2_i1.p1  ORF type:complete len:186 (-),score=43.07 TRINITY_DN23289_c0_g2_i1:87-602(-)
MCIRDRYMGLEAKANIFNFPKWNLFVATKDYADFLAGIQHEYVSFNNFFVSFLKKTKAFLKSSPIGADTKRLNEFASVVNEDFRDDPNFRLMLTEVFFEFFKHLKSGWPRFSADKRLLLITDFMFVILTGLHRAFKLDENYRFDMYKYIEDRESLDISVLRKHVCERISNY